MSQENPKNEVLKSALIGVAALVALVCWLKFQPRLPDVEPKEKIGRRLFENFDETTPISRVEFVGVDAETGEIKELTLVREGDELRLPALANFPAENADRWAKIVAPLVQLPVLDVADEAVRSGDAKKIAQLHRECGVLAPEDAAFEVQLNASNSAKNGEKAPEKAANSTQSAAEDAKIAQNEEDGENSETAQTAPLAALSIKIFGENGSSLVELLVGNRAPESSATRDVRWVRLPGDDVVYAVDFSGDSTEEVGTTQFLEFPQRISFNPIDWADRDLLRISRWDVATLAVRDSTFSVVKAEDGTPAPVDYKAAGIAVFRQNPENSLARVWSLEQRLNRDAEGVWSDVKPVDPESAQNDVLNETADALGRLSVVDVRKKPEALATLFCERRLGGELAAHFGTLAEFGFAALEHDPLNPEKIEPALVGEAGGIELRTKNGVQISLLFGRKFEDKRVCLAFAEFDREALAALTEDETELAFLAPEAEKKAAIKNERLADWFYLISESDFEKFKFRLADVLK
ncbi:MAG: hypothetical protein IKU86_01080 [Thermoguttaceae bacterium]|nr:hypothetical protein [Thermoguttaceae bacterium]